MSGVIAALVEDAGQFQRHLVTVKRGSEAATEERVFGKADTRCIRDLTAAMKDLAAVVKEIGGLPGGAGGSGAGESGDLPGGVVVISSVGEE